MKKKIIVMILLLSVFLTGCPKSNQLENIAVVVARGVDLTEENKINISLAILQFEAQSSQIAKIVTGQGDTTKGAIKNANYETNFKLDSGKLQVELYGKETAKKGIGRYLDTLNRDAHIPDTLYLAVTDTTARELLEIQESGMTINIGQFLHQVIEENSPDHEFPKVTLAKFQRLQNDVGIDPVIPEFKVTNNIPKITSLAVFQNDKYVGKVPINNSILLNILKEKPREQVLEIETPIKPFKKHVKNMNHKEDEKLDTAFLVLRNRANTELVDKENLKFQTNINLKLGIIELSNELNIMGSKVLKTLEKEVEKELVKRYESLLKKLKTLNSDPIGYGSIYRIHKKDGILTDSEWRDKYQDIDVKFNIDVKISQHGEIR